ncbi:splicing factor 3B subunit 2-like [Camellia sinensis]|nr:splicing factor 3B subunit 2-like [Camellia sinensis]
MDLGPNLHAKIFATNLMHSWVFKRTRPVFVLCICLSELSLFHEDQSNQRAKPSFDFAISNQSSKKMTVEVSNGAADALSYPNGDVKHQNPSSATALKKSRETERRRRRRKQKKKNKASVAENGDDSDTAADDDDNAKENGDLQKALEQVEVEYVPEKAELDGDLDDEFRKVFEKFSFKETAGSEENDKKDETATNAALAKKADSDSDEEEQDTQQKDKGFSNKKKKLQRRMKIAELKQICSRPDVVEVWDATASDPKLLVFLKSYRNTVPVPRHWCQKRKFLQGKRGIEKQPFQLPDFIAATGIEKIRQAYIEKEDSKKLKQKQRERMQPKMGKMDIDYQVLHDAFFKYQTKPKLTAHGDLYHEGKEFEVKLREMKPGMLSHELKEALGMPEGAPPPWLINMQRYGPPPSYPHLKIPGLNAPIPLGASFGYHPGGWGKPPVDEFGRPLYGDVFGVQQQEQPNYEEEPVDKTKHWGDLEEEEEEEEEEDEEEVEEQIEEEELEAGIQSVDSLSSTPTGVETPDVIDLRKQQRKEPEKPLYQVLEEKEEKIAPGTLLGTSHTYVIGTGTQDKTAAAKRVDLLRGQKSDRVDVTLQPEELEVMDNVLHAKYEEAREEEKLRSQREDFSDMVAENANKRKRKMQEKEGKSKKKDFKF